MPAGKGEKKEGWVAVLRVSLRRQGGRCVSRSGAAHGCGRGAAAAAAECRTDLGQPRELLNIFEADAIGCLIIAVTNDIVNRLSRVGRDLSQFSLDMVRTFNDGARQPEHTL